jgi:menaquinone-dependent protoporphyrinogen oxidase
MNSRILVAFATQHGSTAGVAEAVGETLAGAAVEVDVRPMVEVRDIAPYSAVVAGSAIHGQWLPEAMQFLVQHQHALVRVPTASFLVCMLLSSPNPSYRQKVSGYMAPVRLLVTPVAEGLFAGAMWYKNYGLALGLGMRIFAAAVKLSEGDHRDWGTIRAWAESTKPLLMK